MFVLSSLWCYFTPYAVHAAKSETAVKAARIPPSDIQGQAVVVFQNAKAPGFCMGAAGGSTKARTPIKQGECKISTEGFSQVTRDQQWIVDQIDTNTFRLRNLKDPSKCLGVDRGIRGRADILLGVCGQRPDQHPDQKWAFAPPKKNQPITDRIKLENSYGLCVGVEGGRTTRAQLKQNKCLQVPDQNWFTLRIK